MADNIYKQMSRAVMNDIEGPLREGAKARKVLFFDGRFNGLGYSNIQTPTAAEMAEATVSYRLPDGTQARDSMIPAMAETKLLSLNRGFIVDRAEFEAFQTKGILMDTVNALSASSQVINKENEVVLKGWSRDGSAYEVNGLAESEGVNEVTTYDFGTFGNALKKVAAAKAAMAAVGAYPQAYHLLLHATQYGQLDASVSTGLRELELVNSSLNPNGGTAGMVMQSTDVSENFGMLLAYDPRGEYQRVYETFPLTVRFGFDSTLGEDTSPIYGTAMERIGLRVSKSGYGIVKLSNI